MADTPRSAARRSNVNALEEINRAIGKLESASVSGTAEVQEIRRLMHLLNDKTAAQLGELRDEIGEMSESQEVMRRDIAEMKPIVQSTRRLQWLGAGILTGLGASVGVAGKSVVQWLTSPP